MTQNNPVTETVLEPELPVCDPHHHLWDHYGNRYLLDDVLADTSGGHNIVSTVFVECAAEYRRDLSPEMAPVGEVEFVNGIAEESAAGNHGPTAIAAGIVGHANLSLGADVAGRVLEALIAASPNRFRGIRNMSAWDADPTICPNFGTPRQGLLLEDGFRSGFSCLSKLGLSFDAWHFHPQIPDLTNLARAFPETTIILDHVGTPLGIGPYNRDRTFGEWKESIADLASCPNVNIKLGGLGMPASGFDWYRRQTPITSAELAEAMAPYYLWCIEQFGADRCMFESNFPVDKVSYSYTTLWNAFKLLSRGFSVKERASLFHDTAVRVYRIQAGGTAVS